MLCALNKNAKTPKERKYRIQCVSYKVNMEESSIVFRYRWRGAEPTGAELASAAAYRMAVLEANPQALTEIHFISSTNGRIRLQGTTLEVEFVPGTPPPTAEEIALCLVNF